MTDPMHAADDARKQAAERGLPVFIRVLDGPADGIPFAVKDNIDVAGVPTTAGCPALDQPADASATVVSRLTGAGYVAVAKTNLDQFATGLVGTRSPYGACESAVAPGRISGGSSSGSAVAVASGVVPLALGTDTAGSGRVPAAFNRLIGFKPTRGLYPTRGVFPACRSLDCVTTFTRDVAGARAAYELLAGDDPLDPYSRARPAVLPPGIAATVRVVGVPAGDIDLTPEYAAAFATTIGRLHGFGVRVVPVDVTPFLAAAQLLYNGPWVAERYSAFGHLLDPDGPHLDPTVRSIVTSARDASAVAGFDAFHELAQLRLRSEGVWAGIDVLLLPTAPVHPTLEEVAADPVGVNSRLGTYTNFVNLLDLCAIAVPGVDAAGGLPFGVQFIAPAFADELLLDWAAAWEIEPAPVTPPAARPGYAEVVLVGAHQSGLPLNPLVAARGGRLLRRAFTSTSYRMKRVPVGVPRPGLVTGDGPGFPVEVWEVPTATLGALAAELAPPLRLGPLTLDDGTSVLGYLGDDAALSDAEDVSEHGGWRHVPR